MISQPIPAPRVIARAVGSEAREQFSKNVLGRIYPEHPLHKKAKELADVNLKDYSARMNQLGFDPNRPMRIKLATDERTYEGPDGLLKATSIKDWVLKPDGKVYTIVINPNLPYGKREVLAESGTWKFIAAPDTAQYERVRMRYFETTLKGERREISRNQVFNHGTPDEPRWFKRTNLMKSKEVEGIRDVQTETGRVVVSSSGIRAAHRNYLGVIEMYDYEDDDTREFHILNNDPDRLVQYAQSYMERIPGWISLKDDERSAPMPPAPKPQGFFEAMIINTEFAVDSEDDAYFVPENKWSSSSIEGWTKPEVTDKDTSNDTGLDLNGLDEDVTGIM